MPEASTYEQFFESSIDLLCVLDFSGHFKRLNPAWERAVGTGSQFSHSICPGCMEKHVEPQLRD